MAAIKFNLVSKNYAATLVTSLYFNINASVIKM